MNTLEKENEQLSVDAKNDILTDMLNRRGFKPKVDEQIKNAAKETFSVAFCDIDNFKRVNDSYGHECGDEVLKHISRMIKKEMSDCADRLEYEQAAAIRDQIREIEENYGKGKKKEPAEHIDGFSPEKGKLSLQPLHQHWPEQPEPSS